MSRPVLRADAFRFGLQASLGVAELKSRSGEGGELFCGCKETNLGLPDLSFGGSPAKLLDLSFFFFSGG